MLDNSSLKIRTEGKLGSHRAKFVHDHEDNNTPKQQRPNGDTTFRSKNATIILMANELKWSIERAFSTGGGKNG